MKLQIDTALKPFLHHQKNVKKADRLYMIAKLIAETNLEIEDSLCKTVGILNGYVWYIFAILSFTSKIEHFCNWEKCFLFHFKSSFFLRHWNFRISNFRILNFMTSSNASSWKKKYALLNNLRSKQSLTMEFGQFMLYYNRKSLSKKFAKNVTRN